jgi:hypothetical protein
MLIPELMSGSFWKRWRTFEMIVGFVIWIDWNDIHSPGALLSLFVFSRQR